MKDFNSYLDNLDYSLVKDLFHEKGKQRIYHKKDFFIRQNEISRFAEWVENGTFQYTEEFYKLKYCSTVVYMVPRA